ncbi:hypothetical protein H4Q26_010635 [Puccinia striiformis f. sp. tritici PST-130]|nr:hypothetical protein H4Q26_010635 [Puccinia striiformis f. sp. tritici PST-130]
MDQPEDKAPPKAKRGCPASPPWPLPDTQPKNLSEAEECFKRHEFSKRQRTFILGVVGLGQEANIDHELDAPGDMANTGVSNNPDEAMDDATRSILAGPSGGAPLRDQGGVLRKLTACKGSSAPREKKRRARNTPDIFFRCQAPNELRNFTKVLGIPQAERMLEHLHVILGIFPDGVPSQCPPGIAFARAGIWVNEWVTEVQNFMPKLFEIPTSYLDVSPFLDSELQPRARSTSRATSRAPDHVAESQVIAGNKHGDSSLVEELAEDCLKENRPQNKNKPAKQTKPIKAVHRPSKAQVNSFTDRIRSSHGGRVGVGEPAATQPAAVADCSVDAEASQQEITSDIKPVVAHDGPTQSSSLLGCLPTHFNNVPNQTEAHSHVDKLIAALPVNTRSRAMKLTGTLLEKLKPQSKNLSTKSQKKQTATDDPGPKPKKSSSDRPTGVVIFNEQADKSLIKFTSQLGMPRAAAMLKNFNDIIDAFCKSWLCSSLDGHGQGTERAIRARARAESLGKF